jgi:hypothetical protein
LIAIATVSDRYLIAGKQRSVSSGNHAGYIRKVFAECTIKHAQNPAKLEYWSSPWWLIRKCIFKHNKHLAHAGYASAAIESGVIKSGDMSAVVRQAFF